MKITCDRCHKEVEGYIQPEASSGVYVLTDANGQPTYWARLAEQRPGEKVICDHCMWTTESYSKEYGNRRTHVEK